MKMKKYSIRCVLFGHTGNQTESGFHVCDRCGMHEYWNCVDNPDNEEGSYELNGISFFLWAFTKYYIKRAYRSAIPKKCIDCGGRYRCNKTDCIPF